MQYIAVAVGAMLGANLRYVITTWTTEQWGAAFPYGTFVVNVSGAFAIGVLVALFGRTPLRDANPLWQLFFATGLLGGYTTFSAYVLQALTLAEAGAWLRAALYVGGSNLVGLLGVWAGAALTNALAGRPN